MDKKHKPIYRIALKEVMERKGITFQQLAEKTGMHYNTCIAIGAGKYSRIGLDTLTLLCDALGVEIGELLVRG